MNLIDLINRNDRAVNGISAANVCVSSQVRDNFKMRTVELPLGTRLTINGAQEFDLLKCYPATVGWKWSGTGKSSSLPHLFRRSQPLPVLKILLVNDKENIRETLFNARVDDSSYWHDIVFKWPPVVATLKDFALVLAVEHSHSSRTSSGTVILGVAPAFNSRELVTKLIKGVGLEIGPGLNPQIRPSADVHVQYVEAAEAKEWVRLYKKKEKPVAAEVDSLWDRYVVSNANFLEGVQDKSLDFIFSNHVFEHLMNPIGVLENWSRKLRASGLIYNVVPDANSCFDLRQPLSQPREWCEEYEGGIWQPDRSKFEKWCKYTAPYNTPEDLISRNYSIHVHYYTPKTAAQLCEMMVQRAMFSSYFIRGAWNHKDFAMILFKE